MRPFAMIDDTNPFHSEYDPDWKTFKFNEVSEEMIEKEKRALAAKALIEKFNISDLKEFENLLDDFKHLYRCHLRSINEYKKRQSNTWRGKVFARDQYVCQKCNFQGEPQTRAYRVNEIELHAHHIELVSLRPDLKRDVNNGITLCQPCHKKYHLSVGGFHKGDRQSLEIFLTSD